MKKDKKQNKLSSLITKFLLFLVFFITITPLNAGPFLKIDKIDDTDFPKIRLFLTVRDIEKGTIAGLNEENLSLYEDGFMVNYIRIKDLSGTNNILYMVYSIDSSKSISKELLKDLKKSAEGLFAITGPNDRVAVYRFNDEVLILNNFTNNRAEIIKNINSIERHGSKTLFYNALYDAIDILNKTDISRKVLIVFTDGKDEGSSIDIDDCIKFARDSCIPVYVITFNPQDRIKLLSRLCFLTGGKLFNSGKKDINDIYKTIISTSKSEYLMEYKSMMEADEKSHNIEVRLKYGSLRDRENASVTVKKSIPVLRIQSPYELIVIALISLLIILLIIFTFLYFINSKNRPPVIQEKICYPAGSAGKVEKETIKKDDITSDESINDRIKTNAWLVEREGINAGKKIPLQHEETHIGRDKENHIMIDDKSASKKHAKIKMIKKSFYLFDMASDKGTFLNENKLLRPKLLYDWDEIRIGKKIFIFRVSNVA